MGTALRMAYDVKYGGRGPGAVYDSIRHHDLGAEYDPHAEGPIQSLIVCLKTSATLAALEHLAPRLAPSSVITLLQNGMGVYDQLCSRLFTDPAKRPFFVLGSITHGVAAEPGTSAGKVLHHTEPGKGDVKFGVVPDSREEVDIDRWLFGDDVDLSPCSRRRGRHHYRFHYRLQTPLSISATFTTHLKACCP